MMEIVVDLIMVINEDINQTITILEINKIRLDKETIFNVVKVTITETNVVKGTITETNVGIIEDPITIKDKIQIRTVSNETMLLEIPTPITDKCQPIRAKGKLN